VVGALAIGIAVVGASIVIGGTQPWNDFRTTMANGLSNEYFPIQSPRSLLWAPLGVVAAGVVAGAITAVTLAAVLRVRDDRAAFSLLGLAMILPAPEWHLHYFIVPVAAALPTLADALLRRDPRRTGAPDSIGAAAATS
jgi:hypothetical protein